MLIAGIRESISDSATRMALSVKAVTAHRRREAVIEAWAAKGLLVIALIVAL
jgi:hypothetical protein